eukprot:8897582-Karenia_brevis.AAC.1
MELHPKDKGSQFAFYCHTKHIARSKPGFMPRGVDQATPQALAEWEADAFSQTPYQYSSRNKVCHRISGHPRRLT